MLKIEDQLSHFIFDICDLVHISNKELYCDIRNPVCTLAQKGEAVERNCNVIFF